MPVLTPEGRMGRGRGGRTPAVTWGTGLARGVEASGWAVMAGRIWGAGILPGRAGLLLGVVVWLPGAVDFF